MFFDAGGVGVGGGGELLRIFSQGGAFARKEVGGLFGVVGGLGLGVCLAWRVLVGQGARRGGIGLTGVEVV